MDLPFRVKGTLRHVRLKSENDLLAEEIRVLREHLKPSQSQPCTQSTTLILSQLGGGGSRFADGSV